MQHRDTRRAPNCRSALDGGIRRWQSGRVPDGTDDKEREPLVELLTPPFNYAVVQLPGRKYPGVVFQGDSLSIHCDRAAEVARLARGSAAQDEAEWLAQELNEVLRSYIAVLTARSIDLPFEYRPSDPRDA